MRFESIKDALIDILEDIKKNYEFVDLTKPSGCKNFHKDLKSDFKRNLKVIQANIQKEVALKYLDEEFYNGANANDVISAKGISIHYKRLASKNLPKKITGNLVNTVQQYTIFLGYMGWKGFLSDPPILITDMEYQYPKKEKTEPLQSFREKFEPATNDLWNREEKIAKPISLFKLRQGSKRYFEELTSVNGRYSHFEINNPERFIEISILHEDSDQNLSFNNAPQCLWDKGSKHFVLIGDGGMGKTLSFIRWWQYYLREEKSPIPIYISLNEYSTDNLEDENFLIKYIAWNYLGIKPLDEITEQKLRRVFVEGSVQSKPDFILFLDGFNEISSDKSALLDDINRNWKTKARNTQIAISSRYDMRYTFNFPEFHLLTINPLPYDVIVSYLEHSKVSFSTKSNFQTLLENPMMLSLYTNSAPTIEKYNVNPNFDFKPIESQGELLWNYFESQYVKYFEYFSSNETKTHFYCFLIKHYLPFLGFEMERRGKYFLSPKELDEILKRIGEKFYNQKFTNAFREFRKFIRYFNLKTKEDPFEEDERIESYFDILIKELQILIKEKDNFWFQHQSFRDFFASIHILNEMEVQITENELPDILRERVLPVYLQKFIGQVEGEHHIKPSIIEEIGWSVDYRDAFSYENKISKTKVLRLLDQCRNQFNQKGIGRIIQNLISILNETRGELTGIDLSDLNLLESNLNGIRYFRRSQNQYLSSNFNGSLISDNCLFSSGHSEVLSSVVYSPNGGKIATASYDNTIKEWSVLTGKNLQTYEGHSDSVKSIIYRFDGKYILSVASDDTIKEWSTDSGECIRTIKEPEGVRVAIYSPDGNIIIYSNRTGVKKIVLKTNQTFSTDKTFFRGLHFIDTLCFNKKGDKFLSGSGSIVIEWDVKSMKYIRKYDIQIGNLIKVLYDPNDEDNVIYCCSKYPRCGIISLNKKKPLKEFCVESYALEAVTDFEVSNGGKDILASSSHGNVYLWDILSENEKPKQKIEVLKTKEDIHSIDLNPITEKFVCLPMRKAAEEWLFTTGTLLRKYGENKREIIALSYSPCGTKFIFGTCRGVIQEWDAKLKKCTNVYLEHTEEITDVAYSPDGTTILSSSLDKTVKLWSTETGICIHTFDEYETAITTLAYSKDSSMIVFGSSDKLIRVYSTSDQTKIITIKEHYSKINDVCFSPDGTKVLSASRGNALREWSVETGACLNIYPAHEAFIKACAYSPDGKFVASGSRDHKIKVWSTITGKCIHSVLAQNNGVNDINFSPNGKKILSCGNNDGLCEWTIGVELKDDDTIIAHKHYINQVEYSPDGQKAISSSNDGTVKEWLVEDWSLIETYEYIHGLNVHGCTFKDLHAQSKISEDKKEILMRHGAIFE